MDSLFSFLTRVGDKVSSLGAVVAAMLCYVLSCHRQLRCGYRARFSQSMGVALYQHTFTHLCLG